MYEIANDVVLVSVSQNMGCQNTDVLAVSKPTLPRMPLKETCHDLYTRNDRFE